MIYVLDNETVTTIVRSLSYTMVRLQEVDTPYNNERIQKIQSAIDSLTNQEKDHKKFLELNELRTLAERKFIDHLLVTVDNLRKSLATLQ